MRGTHTTAIVCSGGGMRSAHGAGFLCALGTMLNITSPDVIVGTSGNAANSFYFIAGQYDFLKAAWTGGNLSTSKFISLLRPTRVIDIDYLIDIVFKKELPLDTEALAHSPIEYYVPLTNAA